MADRLLNPFPRYFTSSLAALSGGQLEFFEAGSTTTNKSTFTDNDLTIENTNPVVLSASGLQPDIFLDGSYRVVLSNSDGVQVDEADNVNASSGDVSAFSLWDVSVDYLSGPSVIVTGSDGNAYFSIQTPNLGNDPTVSPTFWTRKYFISDTDPTMGGPLATNSFQVQWSKGADVASAAALPILSDGNSFDVSGTTAITSIDTTAIGTVIKLHFNDILILTHNATDLILPGAANITTAAGDEAEFFEYATGDYRCTNYSRASGTAVSGGALVFISSATASSDTSIEFTGISSAFDEYEVHLLNVIPVTDSTQLTFRTSTDGGSSFDSGASDYSHGTVHLSAASTVTGFSDTSASLILLSSDNGSAANELGTNGTLRLIRPSESTFTNVTFQGVRTNSSAIVGPFMTGGTRLAAASVDAIQFFFSSGSNVESGLFALYGVNRS